MANVNQVGRFVLIACAIIAFRDLASALCNITKDVEVYEEIYRDYNYGRRLRKIEKGPIIYSCLDTDINEMNDKIRHHVENIMFIKQSNITNLNVNEYSWKNLTELYMENTNTVKIVPGFFKDFNELKVLEITNNQLQFIVDGVFSSLTLLTQLNLSSNSIKTLTEYSLSGLLNLQVLDMSKNKLANISTNTFDSKPFLNYVDISHNFLVDIDFAFAHLLVQTLNLSNNKLVTFDFKQFETNFMLKSIDLSHNELESVPNLNYTCANTLSLAFNQITVLGAAQCIINLNVTNNKLQSLHDSNFTFTLKILDLNYNQIAELDGNYFENATNLEDLNLNHNAFRTIPRNIFLNQNKLMTLNLANNNFEQIPFGVFNNLKSLTSLDLSDNNMVLDFDTLSTLIHLEKLYFKNTKVKNFDPQTLLNRFHNLSYISLSDNLWNCNELAKTIHLMQLNSVKVSNGDNTKTNNIFGVSCKDDVELKEEIIRLQIQKTSKSESNIHKDISVNEYSDALDSLNKTLTQLSANLDTILKTQNAYLNTSVSDLSEVTKADLRAQNDHLRTFLIDFKTLFSTKFPSQENKSNVAPLIIENNNYKLLSEGIFMCNVILILILCCIVYYIFYYIRIQKDVRSNTQEQIHLI